MKGQHNNGKVSNSVKALILCLEKESSVIEAFERAARIIETVVQNRREDAAVLRVIVTLIRELGFTPIEAAVASGFEFTREFLDALEQYERIKILCLDNVYNLCPTGSSVISLTDEGNGESVQEFMPVVVSHAIN